MNKIINNTENKNNKNYKNCMFVCVNKYLCASSEKIKKFVRSCCFDSNDVFICRLLLPDLQTEELDPKTFARSLHAKRACSEQIKSHKFKVNTLTELMCKRDPKLLHVGKKLEDRQYNRVKTLKLSDLHTGPLDIFRRELKGDRNMLYHLDKLMSVLVALRYSANMAQFVSILNLYLGIYYDESIIQTIFEYFESLFGLKHTMEPVMEHQADTFETVKKLLVNWKAIRDSESANKLYKFVSMIITVGLCKVNSIQFSLGKLRVFHMEAEKRVYDLSDIVEVCFETVAYFYERGHEAFVTQDPWKLFYSDDRLLQYEKEFTYLIASSPLIELNDWEELNSTPQEFEMRLETLFVTTQEMIKGSPAGAYRNVLNGKLLSLQKLKTKLLVSKRNTAMRVKPFSLLLYGKTGVGKSTMLDYLINHLSQINGFPVGPEYKCTLNPSDQYDSSYHSTAIAVIMDDIANATPQATTGNPCLKIIDFINNDAKDALKADVDSKGNVKIQPKFVIGTTNKKSLDAYVYSNEPASISRRFDYTITVVVKPEYRRDDCAQLDGAKIPQDRVPDVWLFTVEIVIPVPNEAGGPDSVSYHIVNDGDLFLRNINLRQLLDFLGKKSVDHFRVQTAMLKSVADIRKQAMCVHCHNYVDLCGHEQLEQQVGRRSNGPRFWKQSPEQQLSWYEKFQRRFDSSIVNIPYFPCILFGIQKTQAIIAVTSYKFVLQSLWGYSKVTSLFLGTFALLSYAFIMVFVAPLYYIPVLGVVGLVALDSKMNVVSSSLVRTAERVSLVELNDQQRKKCVLAVKLFGYGVISATTFVALRSLYRNYKHLRDLQGSEEKVPQPGENEKCNVWKQTRVIPLDYTLKSKTTTYEQLRQEVYKVTCHCTAFEPSTGRRFVSNIFPIGRNIWVMNGHAIRGELLELSIVTHDKDIVGGNFNTMISPVNCHFIADSDLVFMYLPAGGDRKDLTPYFPKSWLDISCEASLVYKDEDGEVSHQSIHCASTRNQVGDMTCKGYGYNTKMPTFAGQCMSTLVVNLRHPMIVGFHFAGRTGAKVGAATYITIDMVEEARAVLSKIPGTVICANSGDFILNDIDKYKNVKMLGENHKKSPLNFLTGDRTVRNYGAHNGPRRTYKSAVVKTIISDSVEKVMGEECKHGPPQNMGSYKPWSAAVYNYTDSHVLDQGIIAISAQDMILGMVNKVDQAVYDNTNPLDDMSMLAGADGVYGIDSINMGTGAGHPFNCPKTDIFERSDIPSDTHQQPIYAPQWFFKETKRCQDILLKGERCYLPFKAHLKDEATKLTKDKVRVFTGSSIIALALVRKYFLPLCKIVMDNPYLFECAVGINAHGPEWDEFTRRVTKFGKDRMVAGDYKAFDATMPASLTLAGFSIFIEMARRCGYTDDQLIIMNGLATEICYPIYELNGEFIGINGSNPSGHPLTVFINSFANSLYLRYAFYYISAPKPGKLFNDYVSLQCYGDDNIFSVSEDIPEYNHTSIANALAQYGVTYTMAEKDQPSIPYIPLSECTFLKRRMVYNSEVELYIGPLEESSLFKTLHCVVKSDVLNERQQATECIKCTLQEWFLHGRNLYDKRREQLLEIISINNLQDCFSAPLPTYDLALENFKAKYLGGAKPENPMSDPLVGGILQLEF